MNCCPLSFSTCCLTTHEWMMIPCVILYPNDVIIDLHSMKVKLMGRSSGYIAAFATLASGEVVLYLLLASRHIFWLIG